MGFRIYMFIMILLIPCSMIILGKLFLKSPPKDINSLFGYRTNMSTKNKDTWNFAHKYIGRLWYIIGLVLLPLSAIAMVFAWGKDADFTGTAGGIICAVQLIALICPIFPTEKALKNNFHKNGKRK